MIIAFFTSLRIAPFTEETKKSLLPKSVVRVIIDIVKINKN